MTTVINYSSTWRIRRKWWNYYAVLFNASTSQHKFLLISFFLNFNCMLSGITWHFIIKMQDMFDYSRFSNCYIFRGARPLSLKEVIECLLCSESASAPSWLAWVEDSYIQTVFLMTYVGLSSPACMAAVLACSSVLPRTTLFRGMTLEPVKLDPPALFR